MTLFNRVLGERMTVEHLSQPMFIEVDVYHGLGGWVVARLRASDLELASLVPEGLRKIERNRESQRHNGCGRRREKLLMLGRKKHFSLTSRNRITTDSNGLNDFIQ